MGIFDTYADVQLKAGEPWQNQYNIGDAVAIPDGVYIGTGIVVIIDGKLAATFETACNNWGHPIDFAELESL
jgi:hypothetical protein